MYGMSGHIIDMAAEDVFAAYMTIEGNYFHKNCSVAFQAGFWNHTGWDSLSLYFKVFDMHDESACLVITTTTNWTTEYLGRYCQHDNLTNVVFNVTDGGMLNLYYMDHGSTTNVQLVVTVFMENDGNCSTHVCPNNRCIPNEVVCRGYNPCGDWSDCAIDTAVAAAVAVTFATFLIILISVICKCCFCKSNAKEGVVISRPTATRIAVPDRSMMSSAHTTMRTAESMDIFPDTWDNNSLHENITLEPIYNHRDQCMGNVVGGPKEKQKYQATHMDFSPGDTNGYDGTWGRSIQGAYGMDESVGVRAETPPPSYDEVIAETTHLQEFNRRNADS